MVKSESGKDRISDLPEGIVHCILRRLQTPEQAGRTIILSRRWQSIWQSYPFVEFHPKDELTCSRDREHRRRIFQQFIESSIRSCIKTCSPSTNNTKNLIEGAYNNYPGPTVKNLLHDSLTP
ncbi:hypothetical protein LINPERHAP2_LOCUS30663 [Linum perenne]